VRHRRCRCAEEVKVIDARALAEQSTATPCRICTSVRPRLARLGGLPTCCDRYGDLAATSQDLVGGTSDACPPIDRDGYLVIVGPYGHRRVVAVPFPFSVHALYFSDDAITLENQLHAAFAERKVNRVTSAASSSLPPRRRCVRCSCQRSGTSSSLPSKPDAVEFFQSRKYWPADGQTGVRRPGSEGDRRQLT
jgi:hypothetical protein